MTITKAGGRIGFKKCGSVVSTSEHMYKVFDELT